MNVDLTQAECRLLADLLADGAWGSIAERHGLDANQVASTYYKLAWAALMEHTDE